VRHVHRYVTEAILLLSKLAINGLWL